MEQAADLLRHLPVFGAKPLAPSAAPGQPDRAAGGFAEAAQDFEAMFLAQMLTPMFETLATDGPFSGGSAEQIYRSVLVQEYGKIVAKAGGIGVADGVARELLKLQEMNP